MSEAALDPTLTRPADPDARQLLDPYAKAGRRTKLAVTWEGKAIARDLGPHLKGLTYVDNLSGAADDLQIELEDREALWSDKWRPTFGDKVVARAEVTEAWFGHKVASLNLGTFAHDKIALSGPPWRVALLCVSAPLATGLRRRKRTKAWRGVTLKQIASDIAQRSGMTLQFDEKVGPKYKNAVQNDKSDLEFLQELCKEAGTTLKVTESKIVIYDEEALDATPTAGEIDLRGGHVLGWSFDSDDNGRYGSCHVSCFDPRTGKTSKGQFPPNGKTVPGLDPNGQTLELILPIADLREAEAKAKALLRNANRFATSGKITTIGDPGLVGGVTFDLTNAGGLSGKFMITRAEHHLVGGYTTALDVRRCIEGY